MPSRGIPKTHGLQICFKSNPCIISRMVKVFVSRTPDVFASRVMYSLQERHLHLLQEQPMHFSNLFLKNLIDVDFAYGLPTTRRDRTTEVSGNDEYHVWQLCRYNKAGPPGDAA